MPLRRATSKPPRQEPRFIEPMAARAVKELPIGEDWLYEAKLDGYRVLALKAGARVRLLSRSNKDLTGDFSHIATAVSRLKADTVLLDGEIVAVDAAGVPRFQLLQHRSNTPTRQIVYYAFDLLNLDGQDLSRQPLEERRTALQRVTNGSGVFLSQFLPGSSEDIVRAARALGLEGIVAKRKGSLYVPGLRTSTWLKLRLNVSQELVVGGYSPGTPFDGLLVGYFKDARFLFAGVVRAGFTPALRAALFKRLKPLRVEAWPFANLPSRKSGGWNEGVTAEDMAKMTWVRPELVVQIAFVEWTTYDLLRHASFLGLREDKAARDVRRE